MQLGLSLGVPFRHGISSIPWDAQAIQLQVLTGTADGQTIDDSLTVVTPEPTVSAVPCLQGVSSPAYTTGTLAYSSSFYGAVDITWKWKGPTTASNATKIKIIDESDSSNWLLAEYVPFLNRVELTMNGGTTINYAVPASIETDGLWHTFKLVITEFNQEVFLDDVSQGTGTEPSGSCQSQLTTIEFYSYLSYLFIERTTPSYDGVFESHFDSGAGPFFLSEISNLIMIMDNGVTGLEAMHVTDDDLVSYRLLDGHVKALGFDGTLDNRLVYTPAGSAPDDTIIDMIMDVYCTGDSNQKIMIFNYASFAYEVFLNGTASGGHAMILNPILGPAVYTDAATLDRGWHNIRVYEDTGATPYKIEIDSIDWPTTGTASKHVMGKFALGWAYLNSGIEQIYQNLWIKTNVEEGYIIKGGEVSDEIYNFGVPSDWDVSRVPATKTIYAPPHANLQNNGEAGKVHNQAPVNLVQSGYDIVDSVLLHYPTADTLLLLKVAETNSRGDFQAEGVIKVGTYRLYYDTTQWVLDVPIGGGDVSNPADTLVPPLTGWTGITLMHGYEGSFWVDEDGEFVERSWDDILCNQAGALNLAGLFEKNAIDNCQLAELVQTSLAEQFDETTIAEIASFQGSSGCQGLSTYAVLTDSTPVRTTNGSLVIISQ